MLPLPFTVCAILWLLVSSFPVTTAMPSGHPIDKYTKEMVVSIYKWLVQKGPTQLNTSALAEGRFTKIAEMTKISRHKISEIMREYERNNGRLNDSNCSRPGKKKLRSVDNFTRHVVRNKVHEFYHRNESPTVEKVHTELRRDETYKYSKTTTYKIMKSLGFVFKERNDKLYICERPEIVARRRQYIQQIKKYRSENRNIVYLDETYC